MSYNLYFEVKEDGKVVVDEEGSYTATMPPGKYTIQGHHVTPDGGAVSAGMEWITIIMPTGLVANAQHKVSFEKPIEESSTSSDSQ